MDFIRSNWMGKRTADCVGLIKGYGWYNAESGEIVVGSNGMMDVTANGMFDAATVKGTIDTIPEVPGLAVWHQGHIGIYIGNGEVVEAMNTTRGVTRTKLAGRSWTHWLQIPYISYVEEKENESTLENDGYALSAEFPMTVFEMQDALDKLQIPPEVRTVTFQIL